MNNMKIRTFFVVLLLVCSIALVGVGYFFDLQSRPDSAPTGPEREPYVELLADEREFAVVGSVVEEWTNWETGAAELNEQYGELDRIYASKPVVISWSIWDIPDGSFIRKQSFEIATDENFYNAEHYDLRAGKRNMELDNLLVDTQYFYRITVELENHAGCTFTESFKTKWSPRIVDGSNLSNVRDIGGWKTVDGKTVNQTVMYRGSELDGATESRLRVTEEDVEILCSELQIKTELDLRPSELEGVGDRLGQDVAHLRLPSPDYGNFASVVGKSQMKAVFDVLAEEDRYPVYLHCTDGADQTGVVCYVLDALLGMSEEDCYREWELSVLANGDGDYEVMEQFVTAFRALEGDTLQNKAENYLLSTGITQEQIDRIRAILVQ